jgi:hypothetical protein
MVIRGVVYVPRRAHAVNPQGHSRFVIGLSVCLLNIYAPIACVTERKVISLYRLTSFPFLHIPIYLLIMAIDEATQTNGVAQPEAGHLQKDEADKSSWTVESGMS